MQSNASNVDEYFKEVPSERLEALCRIREICLTELKDYDEVMAYGLPCYQRNKTIEVGFASQKNFIALYFLKRDVMDEFKHLLKGVSVGKGCIRFANVKKIDFDVVEKMVRGTYLSRDEICS